MRSEVYFSYNRTVTRRLIAFRQNFEKQIHGILLRILQILNIVSYLFLNFVFVTKEKSLKSEIYCSGVNKYLITYISQQFNLLSII